LSEKTKIFQISAEFSVELLEKSTDGPSIIILVVLFVLTLQKFTDAGKDQDRKFGKDQDPKFGKDQERCDDVPP